MYRPIKNEMRKMFVKWYSKSVTEELDSGKPVNQDQVGLQMSIIKPLSANWFISAFDYIRTSPDIIINGFEAAGIVNILNMI